MEKTFSRTGDENGLELEVSEDGLVKSSKEGPAGILDTDIFPQLVAVQELGGSVGKMIDHIYVSFKEDAWRLYNSVVDLTKYESPYLLEIAGDLLRVLCDGLKGTEFMRGGEMNPNLGIQKDFDRAAFKHSSEVLAKVCNDMRRRLMAEPTGPKSFSRDSQVVSNLKDLIHGVQLNLEDKGRLVQISDGVLTQQLTIREDLKGLSAQNQRLQTDLAVVEGEKAVLQVQNSELAGQRDQEALNANLALMRLGVAEGANREVLAAIMRLAQGTSDDLQQRLLGIVDLGVRRMEPATLLGELEVKHRDKLLALLVAIESGAELNDELLFRCLDGFEGVRSAEFRQFLIQHFSSERARSRRQATRLLSSDTTSQTQKNPAFSDASAPTQENVAFVGDDPRTAAPTEKNAVVVIPPAMPTDEMPAMNEAALRAVRAETKGDAAIEELKREEAQRQAAFILNGAEQSVVVLGGRNGVGEPPSLELDLESRPPEREMEIPHNDGELSLPMDGESMQALSEVSRLGEALDLSGNNVDAIGRHALSQVFVSLANGPREMSAADIPLLADVVGGNEIRDRRLAELAVQTIDCDRVFVARIPVEVIVDAGNPGRALKAIGQLRGDHFAEVVYDESTQCAFFFVKDEYSKSKDSGIEDSELSAQLKSAARESGIEGLERLESLCADLTAVREAKIEDMFLTELIFALDAMSRVSEFPVDVPSDTPSAGIKSVQDLKAAVDDDDQPRGVDSDTRFPAAEVIDVLDGEE